MPTENISLTTATTPRREDSPKTDTRARGGSVVDMPDPYRERAATQTDEDRQPVAAGR